MVQILGRYSPYVISCTREIDGGQNKLPNWHQIERNLPILNNICILYVYVFLVIFIS